MGKKKGNKYKGRGWDSSSSFGWGTDVGRGKDKGRNRGWDNRGVTLSKDRAKMSAKIIGKPAKVPDEFTDNQAICNHAGDTLSVADFKTRCNSPHVYAPNLDRLVARYGEDRVRVCALCFSPVVDPQLLTAEMTSEAIDILYAASNAAVSNIDDLSSKEVEKLGRMRVQLYQAFGRLPAMIQYINGGGGGSAGDDDLNSNVF